MRLNARNRGVPRRLTIELHVFSITVTSSWRWLRRAGGALPRRRPLKIAGREPLINDPIVRITDEAGGHFRIDEGTWRHSRRVSCVFGPHSPCFYTHDGFNSIGLIFDFHQNRAVRGLGRTGVRRARGVSARQTLAPARCGRIALRARRGKKYVTTSLINLSIRAPAVNQMLNPPSNQALAASEAKSSQARCREGVNSATAAVLHAVSSRRVWRRNGSVVMIKIISFHTVWRCLQTAARDIKRPLWSRAKGSLRP